MSTLFHQDAALFSGTVRENLDPFGMAASPPLSLAVRGDADRIVSSFFLVPDEYTDAECLDALYRVHPHKISPQDVDSVDKDSGAIGISSAPASTSSLSNSGTAAVSSSTTLTLSTRVAASGSNLSQGQKQLVSLARAMLAISASTSEHRCPRPAPIVTPETDRSLVDMPHSYDLYEATATGRCHNVSNGNSSRIHKSMSPIVILDEATSSVDLSTEEGLRSTMKNALDGCTVLCGALSSPCNTDCTRLRNVLFNSRAPSTYRD